MTNNDTGTIVGVVIVIANKIGVLNKSVQVLTFALETDQ